MAILVSFAKIGAADE